MILWKQLWHYTKNYGTVIYERKKNIVDYKKLWNFDWYEEKTIVIYENNWSFSKNIYAFEIAMVLSKQIGYNEKEPYDTIPKTMDLWFMCNRTMVLWKKNYGTIVNYS